MCNTSTAL